MTFKLIQIRRMKRDALEDIHNTGRIAPKGQSELKIINLATKLLKTCTILEELMNNETIAARISRIAE